MRQITLAAVSHSGVRSGVTTSFVLALFLGHEVSVLLQPKLNLKVSQRQALTPGLVQMVSVLALNKLELREMINTEMIENPVLEELEETLTTLDERSGIEGDQERSAQEVAEEKERVEKDPFDEIDFGSYFQDYLDPGFKTASNFEESDKPSFEHFLSQPSTLTDHLAWQLGSLPLTAKVKLAAELIIGNLNEDGYLTANDEELVDLLVQPKAAGRADPIPFERGIKNFPVRPLWNAGPNQESSNLNGNGSLNGADNRLGPLDIAAGAAAGMQDKRTAMRETLNAALAVVHQLDPVGVGARDLRECLLLQIAAQRREAARTLERSARAARRLALDLDTLDLNAVDLNAVTPDAVDVGAVDLGAVVPDAVDLGKPGQPAHGSHATSPDASSAEDRAEPVAARAPTILEGVNAAILDAETVTGAQGGDIFEVASYIVANCLPLLQKKDMRELTRSCACGAQQVQAAVDYIRTLDPRPGQRYNHAETRLIEPDVAFVKRDGQYVIVMNEEEMPTLRLNQGYRKMLRQKQTEKDVREYVKERYKSAIQLLRNIEQRKNTIVRTCEVIVRRQADFLEHGEQSLRPMMIKEVAEEIGVHPSTVSRAVANKYVHTTQGVYELRFFFSEGVNGPEGGDLPLVLLKRKVKKLIEDEDSRKPLTDDQLAAELQRQGIQVTRRTVAKYREDMQIPSTHQRRVR